MIISFSYNQHDFLKFLNNRTDLCNTLMSIDTKIVHSGLFSFSSFNLRLSTVKLVGKYFRTLLNYLVKTKLHCN